MDHLLPCPRAGRAGVTGAQLAAPASEEFGRELRCSRMVWISRTAVELCHEPVDCQADFKIRKVNLGSPPRTFGTDMQNRSLPKFTSEWTLEAEIECSPLFPQTECGEPARSTSLGH